MLRKSLRGICDLCHQYHSGPYTLCQACHAYLEPLGHSCQYCAQPLPTATATLCDRCYKQRPAVDQVMVHYRFTEPLRGLIHAFKYNAALHLSAWLVNLLLQAIPLHYTSECLIPVPLHPKKLRHRGFNQTILLTQALSKILNIPYQLNLCEKIHATSPQAGLDAQQRHTNLRGSFQVYPTPYEHITLIDDIYTTGATANALAELFKQNHVKKIDVGCCARTTQLK